MHLESIYNAIYLFMTSVRIALSGHFRENLTCLQKYHSDNIYLAGGATGSVAVIDTTSKNSTIRYIEGFRRRVYAIALHAATGYYAVASASGEVKLYNAEHACVWTRFCHTDAVYSIAFSADGQEILTASGDGTSKIWSLAGGDIIATIMNHATRLFTAIYISVNVVATSGYDGEVVLSDTQNGTVKRRWQAHDSMIYHMIYYDKDKILITISEDATAVVWDFNSEAKKKHVFVHRLSVLICDLSPNGKLLATVTMDSEIALWNMQHGYMLMHFKRSEPISCLRFATDTQLLYAFGGGDFFAIDVAVPDYPAWYEMICRAEWVDLHRNIRDWILQNIYLTLDEILLSLNRQGIITPEAQIVVMDIVSHLSQEVLTCNVGIKNHRQAQQRLQKIDQEIAELQSKIQMLQSQRKALVTNREYICGDQVIKMHVINPNFIQRQTNAFRAFRQRLEAKSIGDWNVTDLRYLAAYLMLPELDQIITQRQITGQGLIQYLTHDVLPFHTRAKILACVRRIMQHGRLTTSDAYYLDAYSSQSLAAVLRSQSTPNAAKLADQILSHDIAGIHVYGLDDTDYQKWQICRQDLDSALDAIHAQRKLELQAYRTQSSADTIVATFMICPLTQGLMTEPVTVADGYTYEAWAIRDWISHHDTSPMTGSTLANKHLVANPFLHTAQKFL